MSHTVYDEQVLESWFQASQSGKLREFLGRETSQAGQIARDLSQVIGVSELSC